jgi:hypothetical protein
MFPIQRIFGVRERENEFFGLCLGYVFTDNLDQAIRLDPVTLSRMQTSEETHLLEDLSL